jgi:ribonuclease HI/transposase InsO family protein
MRDESAATTRQFKHLGDAVNSAHNQLAELHATVQQWSDQSKIHTKQAVVAGLEDVREDIAKLGDRLNLAELEIKLLRPMYVPEKPAVKPRSSKASVPEAASTHHLSTDDIIKRRREATCHPSSTPIPACEGDSDKDSSNDEEIEPIVELGKKDKPEASTHFTRDPSFDRRKDATGSTASMIELGQDLMEIIDKGSLPPLPMEKFDGDIKEYAMFKADFMMRVERKARDDATRLAYLRTLLSPEVKKVVSDCIRDPTKYKLIWARLDDEYARPKLIARTHLNTMLDLPTVRIKDSKSLKTFSVSLHTAVSAMVQDGLMHDLRAHGNLRTVINKLPEKLQQSWSRYSLHLKTKEEPDITHLNDWLKTKVLEDEEYQSFVLPKSSREADGKSKGKSKEKSSGSIVTINHIRTAEVTSPSSSASASSSESKVKHECYVCHEPMHKIYECSKFLKMSSTERAKVVYEAGRCFRCLTGKDHSSRTCPKKKIIFCKVAGCKRRKHHTLLHGAKFERPTPPAPPPSTSAATLSAAAPPTLSSSAIAPPAETPFVGTALCQEAPRQRRTMLGIVPVCISVGTRKFNTFAFLDPGASSTLIRRDVATTMLGLCGPTIRTSVAWFDGSEKEVDATIVTFDISNNEETIKFRAYDAYAVDDIRMSSNVPLKKLPVHKWTHVQGLEFADVQSKQITVVIANDIDEAHDRLETRRPPAGSFRPSAHRTHFGWVLSGRMIPPGITEPRMSVAHISINENQQFQDLLERFWAIEANHLSSGPVLSERDKQGLHTLESTIKNVGNRYEIGLMWKSEQVRLPDNRKVALRRMFSQERRFEHDPEYARKYNAVIEEYINLGHARYLSKEEAEKRSDKTWYLPHHGVVSATSTTTKVRVVFDGASEFQGTSLNKNMLRGPNLLNNLVGVALRARKYRVAVCSDIEKMYHQVLVPEHEQDAYRFVYRPPGSDSPPLTLRMKVHVFGSKTSPTTCLYALKRTAEDNRSEFPRAAESVLTSFYVDNYWESFPTEDEAIRVSRDLKALLAKGGFNLTKWTSNSKPVLVELKELGLANPSSDLELEKLDIERTLGLLWDRDRDSFIFKINKNIEEDWRPTRKQFLSVVLSVFDPLGFVAPVVFTMKVLMQKVCGNNVNFDEKVPEEFLPEFIKWCKNLHHLEEVSIPRSFTSSTRQVVSRQLHVFTDASNAGYGAVAYVRTATEDGEVRISFVMAKTHVAPIKKKQTIPRLELLGAIEGLALAMVITSELQENMKDVVFHTDSQIVLRWINSSTCKFEVFVENRIGKIVQETDRKQWRFVPGVDNPADMCSRGLQPQQLSNLEAFHTGPAFLRREESEWPQWDALHESDNEMPEALFIYTLITVEDYNVIEHCIERSSKSLKVIRVIAWCLRFISNSRAKRSNSNLTRGELGVEEMDRALKLCIKHAQVSAYAEEMKVLTSSNTVPAKSDLKLLTPFKDEDGLLRVGGRLDLAPFAYSAKHPIILPPRHQFTLLIVRDYHLKNFHIKSERLLADLRQTYWIPKGRRVVKSIVRACVPCRKREAKAICPFMAPLPRVRLTPHVIPFTFTGIDFFGPLMVSMGGRGKRFEKRWICLFTCLTVRAVHLEVADGMSADEFLLCFARFCSIRGKPSEIYTDNGTNFVAAQRELRDELEKLYQSTDLQAKIACQNVKWQFSPPNAPHFGGAWERLVQSSKRLLRASVGNQLVNDRTLRTVIYEVAAMQNARPLTQLSVDPSDEEPLTPNHFLFGGSRAYVPLALSELQDLRISSKQFRQGQQILDHLWSRWTKELSPELIQREKWFVHKDSLSIGDLVLVHDPNNIRGQWPVGRVVEIMKSSDNVPRVVKLALSRGRGELVRAISSLVPLIVESDENK